MVWVAPTFSSRNKITPGLQVDSDEVVPTNVVSATFLFYTVAISLKQRLKMDVLMPLSRSMHFNYTILVTKPK